MKLEMRTTPLRGPVLLCEADAMHDVCFGHVPDDFRSISARPGPAEPMTGAIYLQSTYVSAAQTQHVHKSLEAL